MLYRPQKAAGCVRYENGASDRMSTKQITSRSSCVFVTILVFTELFTSHLSLQRPGLITAEDCFCNKSKIPLELISLLFIGGQRKR